MSLTTMRPKYIKSYPKDQKTKRHKELTNQETRRPKYIIWCGGGMWCSMALTTKR